MQLNQDKSADDDDMSFDEPESKEGLTVNLTNLVGNSTPDDAKNVTNNSEK